MSCIKTLVSRSNPLVKPLKNPYESLLNNPIHKSLFNFFSTKPQESLKSFSDKNGVLNNKLKEENVGFLNEIEEEEKGKDGVVSNPKTETLLWDIEGEEKGRGKMGSFNLQMKNLSEHFYLKEISQDMQLLLRLVYDCGYFKDVKFLPENKFDLTCFHSRYAHGYVTNALKRFSIDNKAIFESLSMTDAKSIALVGCPTLAKRDVFAAKHLRSFFKISEESVCNKCVLNDTCKYRDERDESDVSLESFDSLLRLLKAYSQEEVYPQVKLTDDMKACVSRLIHQVMKLSKGVDEVAADGGDETHPS